MPASVSSFWTLPSTFVASASTVAGTCGLASRPSCPDKYSVLPASTAPLKGAAVDVAVRGWKYLRPDCADAPPIHPMASTTAPTATSFDVCITPPGVKRCMSIWNLESSDLESHRGIGESGNRESIANRGIYRDSPMDCRFPTDFRFPIDFRFPDLSFPIRLQIADCRLPDFRLPHVLHHPAGDRPGHVVDPRMSGRRLRTVPAQLHR